MAATSISVKIGTKTYNLLDHQDPDEVNDRHLFYVSKGLKDKDLLWRMEVARRFKGGYEPWVQVESGFSLTAIFAPDSIEREAMCYKGNTNKIDIWADDGNDIASGIEMKCRGRGFDAPKNVGGLPSQVIDDIVKIGMPLTGVYDVYPRVMYAIGITGNPWDLVWDEVPDQGQTVNWFWKNKDIQYKNKVRWSYLGKTIPVSEDLKADATGEKWDNLYLVWYEVTMKQWH